MPRIGKQTEASNGSTVEASIKKVDITIGKALMGRYRSQQVKSDKTLGAITPPIDFDSLLMIYDNSYIIGGIADKVARTANSGIEIANENTNSEATKKAQIIELAEKVDYEFLFLNQFVLGNAFFEIIKDVKGNIVNVEPILSGTIKLLKGGEGYVQKIGNKKAYFNSFYAPSQETEKKSAIERYTKSGAGENELIGSDEGAGYNETLNEVYQFKGVSLTNPWYGDSPIKKVVMQAILIANIDKFYNMIFEKSNINNKIYYNKAGKLTEKQRQELQDMIRDAMKGLNNAFKSVVMNGEMGSLDIGDSLDDKAFLEKVTQLEQAVCIGLNVPYDLLKSTNSNKASATIAIKVMYKQLIEPMQTRAILNLKKMFEGIEGVETLQFKKVDTQDLLELVEAITKLVDRDIITRYEARQDLGYSQRNKEDLDTFAGGDIATGDTTANNNLLDQQANDVQKLYHKKDLPKEE